LPTKNPLASRAQPTTYQPTESEREMPAPKRKPITTETTAVPTTSVPSIAPMRRRAAPT